MEFSTLLQAVKTFGSLSGILTLVFTGIIVAQKRRQDEVLERVKVELENQKYAFKSTFDEELKFYVNLWNSVVELKNSKSSLRKLEYEDYLK